MPTPQFDPRSLLPPRIQRFGRADMGPDQYPVLDIGTGGVAKLNPQSPDYGLSYPGSEGTTNSVTVGCSAGGAAKTKVAIKCTLVPQVGLGKKGRHRATPKAKAGATLDITRTSTAGRTPDTMTPQGKRASLLVTTETSTKVGVEAKLKKLDVSYKKITNGHKTTYQITGTPARIAQIASDPSLAPDVRDPRTIKSGDGVLIGEENFDGDEGSASVNSAAGVENSNVKGTRQSAGVQRVNGRTIRITVGDDAFVRQVIRSGLGNSTAGIGISNTLDDAQGNARQVDLDISTPTGWADYQTFLRTGRLDYHPGLTFATMDRRTSTGSHGYYVKLGPFEHSETLSSGNEEVRDLKHSDGSKERYFTRRYNDVTVYTDARKGGDGPGTPTTRYLLLDGANAGLVEHYRERAGAPPRTTDWGGKANVRIAFTDADLKRLRENAITWYRQHLNRDVGGDLDRAGTVKYARTDYATYPIGRQAAFDIVRARTPNEVLMALYAGSDGRPDEVLDELERNADSQDGGPLPGLTDLP